MTLNELQGILNSAPFFSGIYLLAIGATVGSFCHFIAYRLAFNLPLSESQSRCDACNSKLKRRYNIPLIGYILLHGKAACCKKSLTPLHFFYELLFSIVTISVFLTKGINTSSITILLLSYVIFTRIMLINYTKTFTFNSLLILIICLQSILFLSLNTKAVYYFDSTTHTLLILVSYFVVKLIENWTSNCNAKLPCVLICLTLLSFISTPVALMLIIVFILLIFANKYIITTDAQLSVILLSSILLAVW